MVVCSLRFVDLWAYGSFPERKLHRNRHLPLTGEPCYWSSSLKKGRVDFVLTLMWQVLHRICLTRHVVSITLDCSKTLIEVCPEPPISLPTCNIGLLRSAPLAPSLDKLSTPARLGTHYSLAWSRLSLYETFSFFFSSIEKRIPLRLTAYLSFSKTYS